MIDKNSWGLAAFALLIAVIAVASYWVAPMAFGAVELSAATVFSLLTMIFVITLFVERAQEVILTNWRALGSEKIDLNILALERQLQRVKSQEAEPYQIESLITDLESERLLRLRYRAKTRVLAMRIGVLMGVAVSLAGVRTLGTLVPADIVMAFSAAQQMIFYGVDVVLTGGVIAGGSDGIHKMAELYRAFVEARADAQRKKLSPLS